MRLQSSKVNTTFSALLQSEDYLSLSLSFWDWIIQGADVHKRTNLGIFHFQQLKLEDTVRNPFHCCVMLPQFELRVRGLHNHLSVANIIN